jgi:hypothetical protein
MSSSTQSSSKADRFALLLDNLQDVFARRQGLFVFDFTLEVRIVFSDGR